MDKCPKKEKKREKEKKKKKDSSQFLAIFLNFKREIRMSIVKLGLLVSTKYPPYYTHMHILI
jgi:hypothetical protein